MQLGRNNSRKDELAFIWLRWYRANVETIDLVLIDSQSVGKRSLDLMDTVSAKMRWTIIYWCVNKFFK
jgi:hypothetical protein